MSLVVEVNSAAIVDAIQPSSVGAQMRADDGDSGFGGFLVDDPGATVTTTGHHVVTVEESACSQPRLFTGYLTERDISRSLERGMIAGDDARAHQATAVDANACFSFRVIHGSGAKRPDETMEDRLTWLLGSDYLAPFIEDTGLVSYYSLMMDEADYTGATPAAVLDDLVERKSDTTLTYFAYWDATAQAVGLYFGLEDTGTGESTLYISNDLADIDSSTTFAPDAEAKLSRTPEEVYSEVVVEYAHGTKRVFRSRAATETTFGIARGTTIQRPYTGRATTAQSQADRWLTKHGVERDEITVSIIVPPASAGLALAGQRINVKFTHLDDYTTWTSMRIVTSTVTPFDDTATQYRVELVLRMPIAGAAPPFEPECSFEAAVVGTPSSTDVWGAYYDFDGTFYPVSPVPDVTVAVSGVYWTGNPITTFGTANNGSDFGIDSGVTGSAQTVTASWTWDFVTSQPICYVGVDSFQEYGLVSIRGSDNGSDWTTVVGPAAAYSGLELTPIDDPYPAFRYWQLYWQYTTNAGLNYFPGNVFQFVLLWAGTSEAADTELDLGSTPTSPIETNILPTANDDGAAGYSVGQVWVDTTTGAAYVLVDATAGAAVWALITGGSSGDFVSIRDGGMEEVNTVAAAGATETLNLASGNVHDITLDTDCTLTFTGATAGVACSFTLLLRQDGTGGWTTTWPGSVVWAGGSAPTLDETASTVSVLTFFTLDGGTVWYGFPTGGGVAGGTPALTFGTSNAQGSAATAVLTDATLAIFDATSPTTLAFGGSAATGSAAFAARRDHSHGMPASPVTAAALEALGVRGELLVSDGTTGPNGISPSSYVEEEDAHTTTSATLEDITDVTTTITLQRTSHVAAWLNTQISASGVCVIGIALNFDGTDHDEMQHALSGTDAAALAVVHRTATALAPGTYTVKGRMRRVSGASTPSVDRADLLVMAMGHSGPVMLTNEAEDDYLYANLA